MGLRSQTKTSLTHSSYDTFQTMTTSSTMKALAVRAWGQTPELITIPVKPAGPNESQIRILASGLPNLVRSQASGTHYTTSKASLPYFPGIDGVGVTENNELVFVSTLTSKPCTGTFTEILTVDDSAIVPLELPPSTNSKEAAVKIAALVNPTLSSWMALRFRANISTLDNWNCLILGVTSTSGRIAAMIARHLGATRIIGAARDATALEYLKMDGTLNETIVLDKKDVSKTNFSTLVTEQNFPHVILDYIWGLTALAVLNQIPRSAMFAEKLEVRYIHVGTLGGETDVAIPGPLLRAKNVTISGSGPGSWSVKALARETRDMATAIVNVLPSENWKEEYNVVERTLEQVDEAWEDTVMRSVFVMS